MFRLFRLCRKEEISRKTSFDVLPNCNNVEATFDFVERIVRLVALTMLLRHIFAGVDGG